MDDGKDKGIIEKTIEAVEEFASEVKDTAKHMMDPPEPLKPGDEVDRGLSLDNVSLVIEPLISKSTHRHKQRDTSPTLLLPDLRPVCPSA
jgi:hypothetical protein